MSFVISEQAGRNGRLVLAIKGVIQAAEGPELFGRIRAALEDHGDVALDLRRCVFVDPSHLTSVLRLRRALGANGSKLSLVGNGVEAPQP